MRLFYQKSIYLSIYLSILLRLGVVVACPPSPCSPATGFAGDRQRKRGLSPENSYPNSCPPMCRPGGRYGPGSPSHAVQAGGRVPRVSEPRAQNLAGRSAPRPAACAAQWGARKGFRLGSGNVRGTIHDAPHQSVFCGIRDEGVENGDTGTGVAISRATHGRGRRAPRGVGPQDGIWKVEEHKTREDRILCCAYARLAKRSIFSDMLRL